jgi:ABC-type antimicrobial peptide transport system permease subunit
VLAVLIACVGLYGTMAYRVARRTNEIGIRMALGAERRGLIWLVLRDVLIMAAAGLAIGIPVARATSSVVESFLFGLKANDWGVTVAAATVLVAAALAAGFGPAWKASRVDPWIALRDE